MIAARAFALATALALLAGSGAHAQGTSETQRKLEKLKRELKDVASQRRRTEGQRGDATRALRLHEGKIGTLWEELGEVFDTVARSTSVEDRIIVAAHEAFRTTLAWNHRPLPVERVARWS